MKEYVREQLLLIASDFIEHLGLPDLAIEDITISGSNAAYSYTELSDIDLHILVDISQFSEDDVYRELFDAKKTVYNDNHDILMNGYEVELYVQDSNEPVISLGEYSVMNDKWLKLPRKRKADFDQLATKLKYRKLYKLAHYALKSNDSEKISKIIKTIKKYRKIGLDFHGEFGPENIAFKALRNKGIIKKLYEKLPKKTFTILKDVPKIQKTIEDIYTNKGNIAGYLELIKKNGKLDPNENQDSLYFIAAEIKYREKKYNEAFTLFDNYLEQN
jgi:hypothetical protein